MHANSRGNQGRKLYAVSYTAKVKLYVIPLEIPKHGEDCRAMELKLYAVFLRRLLHRLDKDITPPQGTEQVQCQEHKDNYRRAVEHLGIEIYHDVIYRHHRGYKHIEKLYQHAEYLHFPTPFSR